MFITLLYMLDYGLTLLFCQLSIIKTSQLQSFSCSNLALYSSQWHNRQLVSCCIPVKPNLFFNVYVNVWKLLIGVIQFHKQNKSEINLFFSVIEINKKKVNCFIEYSNDPWHAVFRSCNVIVPPPNCQLSHVLVIIENVKSKTKNFKLTFLWENNQ